jgi:dGTP triphosphohydrolase
MSTQLTPEQRKQRLETILKVVGVGVVGFIVAPFVLQAIGGLIGLGIAAAIGYAGITFSSYFSMKIANWRLKAIKAEAMKNPVETLQNQYVQKQRALEEYKTNIAKFAAQVMAFADQVKQYVKDGLEDAQTYVEQLGKMKQLLELRKQKYQEAQDTLAEFSETIARTEKKWKMACAAMAMNEAAGQIEGDVFDKICIETALDSVQTKLNQSFADLEIALMDDEKEKRKLADKQAKALPPVSRVIDVDAQAVPVMAQRQRIAE